MQILISLVRVGPEILHFQYAPSCLINLHIWGARDGLALVVCEPRRRLGSKESNLSLLWAQALPHYPALRAQQFQSLTFLQAPTKLPGALCPPILRISICYAKISPKNPCLPFLRPSCIIPQLPFTSDWHFEIITRSWYCKHCTALLTCKPDTLRGSWNRHFLLLILKI